MTERNGLGQITAACETPTSSWFSRGGSSHWVGLYDIAATRYWLASLTAHEWHNIATGARTPVTFTAPVGSYKVVLFEVSCNAKNESQVHVIMEARPEAQGCVVM